jgi:glutamyl-tRNA reductase
MELFVAGLSYKTAPVEMREKLAAPASRLRCYGCRLRLTGGLSELVLVSTCNRVELYGVTGTPTLRVRRLFEELSGSDFDFTPYLYVKHGTAAIEHLFSVASGLDSMVIGETEITGQVKQAYLAAQEAKLTGRWTNRLFQTALQVAKEIRTQTAIGRGSTSVGSVAVDLAQRIFDQDLKNRTVMIIGAGKMGEACVRHLAKKGAQSVIVTNRSFDRAVNLAAEFGGRALEFTRLREGLAAADIIVSSTGAPQTILHAADIASVMAARRNRPLFLIDIAVPRDIDDGVQQLPNVYLYNVDHLEEIVRENVRLREQELAHCHQIIQSRVAELNARFTPPTARAPILTAPQWAINSGAAFET